MKGGIYLSLVLFTVIAYWPVRLNDFVDYDDSQYVTDNPHVTEGLTVQNIGWAFTTPHAGNWHPATWISHMLDCQLFGMNATWHHLHNLLLHLVNALLLFELLRRMSLSGSRRAGIPTRGDLIYCCKVTYPRTNGNWQS